MILTNCNEIINVLCGCALSFVPNVISPSYNGKLSAGSLVGTGCTGPITNYIIDWYLNATLVNNKWEGGTKVLTTGSRLSYSSDIQWEHPFFDTTNNAGSIPAEYFGLYCPVVRKIEIGGQDIYGIPTRCKNYCNLNYLPAIDVQEVGCGMVGGSPSANYSFRVYYFPTQPPINRINKFNFVITPYNNYKYVAVRFWAGTSRYDSFRLYYNDQTNKTLLTSYAVGTNISTDNSLNQLGEQYLYLVLDYTQGRTVKEKDSIYVEAEASSTLDTQWDFQIICLKQEDLEISPGISQCNYFYPGLRDFNFDSPYTPTTEYANNIAGICGFRTTFYLNQMINSAYATSNLAKYTNIRQVTSHNLTNDPKTFSINFTTGEIKATLYYNRMNTGCYSARSSGVGNLTYSKVVRYFDPRFNKSQFICYDIRDYQAYKGSIDSKVNKNGVIDFWEYINGTYTDKTDMFYYRYGSYGGKQSSNSLLYGSTTIEQLACGDTAGSDHSNRFFHTSSPTLCINNFAATTSASEMNSALEDMAEIRFRSLVKGTGYTSPTITVEGDLTCIVLNKIPNSATVCQADSILVRGNSGILTIQGPGSPDIAPFSIPINKATKSIKDTLQEYFTQPTIQIYAAKNIEVSAFTTVEIRFKAVNPNITYTSPTVLVSGDITAFIISRTVAAVGIRQSDSIILSGTTGTVTISGTGGITTSFTADNNTNTTTILDLASAVADFASTRNGLSPAVAAYEAAGIELSAYTGFICSIETNIYDGIRNDYNLYYNKDFITYDPTRCDTRSEWVLGQVNTLMSHTSSRTLTVRDAYPSVGAYGVDGWSRGEIIRGRTSSATCEIVSWKGANQYDIKYTTSGTFVAGEQLQNELKNKIAYFVSISALPGPECVYTNCRTAQTPNGCIAYHDFVNEIYKDFYYYYEYPLVSLNNLCGGDTNWWTSGNKDIYNILYTTINFHKTSLEDGLTPEQVIIAKHRENNFEIYTRIDEIGEIFSVLRVNVNPETPWAAGDIVRGTTSTATCKIIGSYNDPNYPGVIGYYVEAVNGRFVDKEIIGVTGVAAKQAQQDFGAPRIVGKLVYKKENGNQIFPEIII